MKWPAFLSRRKGNSRVEQVRPQAVKQAARDALKRYEKTFIDLAKYDRGESISTLPR